MRFRTTCQRQDVRERTERLQKEPSNKLKEESFSERLKPVDFESRTKREIASAYKDKLQKEPENKPFKS